MFQHFPHYTQHDAADCGPACLRMIASFYGHPHSAEMLRRHCYISRDGVSLLGISDAAEYIGFRALPVRITLYQLAHEARLPCILHWDQNHFVVCYKITVQKGEVSRVYIADPGTECVSYSRKEFEAHWFSSRKDSKNVGVALLLEPTPAFGERKDEFDCHEEKSIASFARYFSPYKGLVFQLLVGMALGSLLQLVFPFLTQVMVDRGINGKNVGLVFLLMAIQFSIFLGQFSVGFIRSWIMLYINSRVDISIFSDFLQKLTNMPLHFFDTRNVGDIMQRMGDHNRIKGFLMGNTITLVFSMANLLVFCVLLGAYSLKVLGILLLGNTINIGWTMLFLKYRRELDIKHFHLASLERNNVLQLIHGMQDIKLNNCEKQKRWDWEQIQIRLFKINVKELIIGQIQETGATFFSHMTNLLITAIAALSVIHGDMTLGMMMSMTYMIAQITAPIGSFIGFIQALQDAKISLDRLNEIHSQEDEEASIGTKVSILPGAKSISLRNVSFSYSGAPWDYAIRDIDLQIPIGKVTAIVGESGSGKTTLIKLLQGFYNPTSGAIYIGSQNLKAINQHLWRNVTGGVMQESYIFSDTIAGNIALGHNTIDIERLLLATQIANIDQFINSLPLGYNTKIGMEGVGLSQGQRQRILIARAVYKNPDYFFFDEATNALDAKNESIIMSNLKEFYRNKTVVIAAHRLSTIMDADQIVVIDQGGIKELGDHKTLFAKKGEYYRLVENQIGKI